MSDRPVVAITMGDPAGIGAEIVVKGYDACAQVADVVVVGSADALRRAVEICESPLSVEAIEDVAAASFAEDAISVLDVGPIDDLEYGVVREEYGAASLAYVERAIELATAGEIDAITTAPIHKQAVRLAGGAHAGHTGLLADRTDADVYAMLLVHDDLRVSHVSTHVPLREACDLVTTESVLDTIRVTDRGLRELEVAEPTIAVAGLNPHASDGGLLGDAEATEIEPAIERAREEGIDAFGPEPPDTIFARAADGAADCVVAMYHDQGHIPIKMLGFREESITGVNVTVGLPIVRTSVDHGTAFDIAGEGVADPQSLIDAVEVAAIAAR